MCLLYAYRSTTENEKIVEFVPSSLEEKNEELFFKREYRLQNQMFSFSNLVFSLLKHPNLTESLGAFRTDTLLFKMTRGVCTMKQMLYENEGSFEPKFTVQMLNDVV